MHIKFLLASAAVLVFALTGLIVKRELDMYEEMSPATLQKLNEACVNNGGPAVFQKDGRSRWFAVCKDGRVF